MANHASRFAAVEAAVLLGERLKSKGRTSIGRNQQAQVRTQGNTLLGTENTNASANQAQAAGTFNAANAGYTSLYNNPGYDPATKSAITNATEGGIGAATGAANQLGANRAARTRNSAGLASSEDNLSRTGQVAAGTIGSQNQITEANAARADQQTALAGIRGLYGTATGTGLGYTGAANTTLGTLNNSANQQNPFLTALGGAAGKSLGTFGFSSGPSGTTYSG